MKKLFFFLSFVTLLSCSSSDDNSNNKLEFHPPAWIQGTWMQIINGQAFNGYKFTSNNVCIKLSPTTEQCYKEMLDSYNNSVANPTISEPIISSTEYKFSFTMQGSTQTYHFRKISNTEIEWISTYDIPLTKQ